MKIARIFQWLALFAIAISISTQHAQADPIIWTLQGVMFDDGASAMGSFTYDAATNTYSNWDMSTANQWVPPDSTVSLASASEVLFMQKLFPPFTFLDFTFLSPLTDAGGTIGLAGGYEKVFIRTASFTTLITGGSVTAPAAVPEPSTFVLLASGIVIGGLIKRFGL